MNPSVGARRLSLRCARAFSITLAACLVAFAFDAAAQPGPADGIWSRFDFPVPDTPPSGRAYCGMVLDPVRQRMIVIGGHPDRLNDVWALPLDTPAGWQKVLPGGTPPSPRFAHAVIYQPGQDRVILFGGFDGVFRNDVWALSLAGAPGWSQIAPSGTPPAARWAHVAVYDPAGDRMIVFGGYDGSGTRNDVWALSLGAMPAWTQLDPGGRTPAARTNMDGVYDAGGNRLIVFGGFDTATQQFFDDTWSLTLGRNPVWKELNPHGSPPSPRRDHAVVYDAARRRLVVFGGFGAGLAPLDDARALTLDPSPSWSAIDAGIRPSARFGHRAIYDTARDRMLAFGGNDGAFRNDAWALPLGDPSAWSDVSPPTSVVPSPRRHHALAYAEGWVVLFGGDGGGVRNDAYLLTLGATPQWQPIGGAGAPSPRAGHRAIYDAPRQRVVVFGGSDGMFYSDVHALSLPSGTWAPVNALGTPPSARSYHGMVYDPVRERMIVIGGHPDRLNDVWALPLNAAPVWQQLLPLGTPPSPRFAHVVVYQPNRDRVILFGGFDGSFRNDVWALSLAGTPAWSAIAPSGTRPAGRWSPSAIYDPVRDRMIVFGGYDGSGTRNDVWALSLGLSPTWTQLTPQGTPPLTRAYMDGVYDPIGSRMIFFGGFDTFSQQLLNDTWALAWPAPAAPPPAARAVPGHTRLALAGVRPNPVAGAMTIAFSLPDAGPARIEMMDVAGRRVLSREVGGLGAGDHALRFEEAGTLPPGLYFVRLRQHGSALTARVLIAR